MNFKNVGNLVIKHWEGDINYVIVESIFKFREDRIGIKIVGDIINRKDSKAILGNVVLTIWAQAPMPLSALFGKKIIINGSEFDTSDCKIYSNLYIGSHHICKMTELNFNADGRLKVRCVCEDINYYGKEARDNIVEIDAIRLEESQEVYDVY